MKAHYDAGSFSADTHNMVAASSEGDVIYLAFSDGIYRHTIGGSAIEEVADGSLNSLGNPMMQLRGMTVLEDEVFLPQKENREVYRRGFEKYREIYKRLKDLM